MGIQVIFFVKNGSQNIVALPAIYQYVIFVPLLLMQIVMGTTKKERELENALHVHVCKDDPVILNSECNTN